MDDELVRALCRYLKKSISGQHYVPCSEQQYGRREEGSVRRAVETSENTRQLSTVVLVLNVSVSPPTVSLHRHSHQSTSRMVKDLDVPSEAEVEDLSSMLDDFSFSPVEDTSSALNFKRRTAAASGCLVETLLEPLPVDPRQAVSRDRALRLLDAALVDSVRREFSLVVVLGAGRPTTPSVSKLAAQDWNCGFDMDDGEADGSGFSLGSSGDLVYSLSDPDAHGGGRSPKAPLALPGCAHTSLPTQVAVDRGRWPALIDLGARPSTLGINRLPALANWAWSDPPREAQPEVIKIPRPRFPFCFDLDEDALGEDGADRRKVAARAGKTVHVATSVDAPTFRFAQMRQKRSFRSAVSDSESSSSESEESDRDEGGARSTHCRKQIFTPSRRNTAVESRKSFDDAAPPCARARTPRTGAADARKRRPLTMCEELEFYGQGVKRSYRPPSVVERQPARFIPAPLAGTMRAFFPCATDPVDATKETVLGCRPGTSVPSVGDAICVVGGLGKERPLPAQTVGYRGRADVDGDGDETDGDDDEDDDDDAVDVGLGRHGLVAATAVEGPGLPAAIHAFHVDAADRNAKRDGGYASPEHNKRRIIGDLVASFDVKSSVSSPRHVSGFCDDE